MQVEVKSCSDCPLCNNDMEKGISCNYPGNNVEDYQMPSYNEEWIPANCPLIQTDILVRKSIGAAVRFTILSTLAYDKDGNKVDCWSPDVDHDKTFELKKKK